MAARASGVVPDRVVDVVDDLSVARRGLFQPQRREEIGLPQKEDGAEYGAGRVQPSALRPPCREQDPGAAARARAVEEHVALLVEQGERRERDPVLAQGGSQKGPADPEVGGVRAGGGHQGHAGKIRAHARWWQRGR